MTDAKTTIYTVGHSTREADAFRFLLERHDVSCLVDVRRFPSSRRHPHFERERLRSFLEANGVRYRHEERLGGRRGNPDGESDNAGWRSQGFRAYADHMLGEPARRALDRLLEEAREWTTAIMCAEAVPWRCHRQIIADWLVARGLRVRHIVGPDSVEEHELRAMARVREDGTVVYPAEEAAQGDLFPDD